MPAALLVLLACQLAGEAISRLAALPVPGPVFGMILLFLLLGTRRWLRPRALPIEHTGPATASTALLANLSLLFVPAGAGVVQQGGVLLRNGLGLIVALVVSTALTLAVTAWVFAAVSRLVRR